MVMVRVMELIGMVRKAMVLKIPVLVMLVVMLVAVFWHGGSMVTEGDSDVDGFADSDGWGGCYGESTFVHSCMS